MHLDSQFYFAYIPHLRLHLTNLITNFRRIILAAIALEQFELKKKSEQNKTKKENFFFLLKNQ